MRSTNETLLRHRNLTLTGAVAPMLFLLASPVLDVMETDPSVWWLTWIVLAFVFLAAVPALMFDRMVGARPDEILALLLAFALTPFFVAWVGVMTLGTHAWVMYVGLAVSTILVVYILFAAGQSQQRSRELTS